MGQKFVDGKLRCSVCAELTTDHAPTANRCRPCDAAKSRRYYDEHRPKVLRRITGTLSSMRQAAVAAMGGECTECGSRVDLEFDHVNGGGTQHRKVETYYMMYKRIIDNGGQHPEHELRLLCAPCHRYVGYRGEPRHCAGCMCDAS